MRTRNRFLAAFAIAMVAGFTVYRVGYTDFNGYGTYSGSTCLRCRASQIEITACGWQYNQHVRETECSRWYNSHRPTHTHHWIKIPFSRTRYLPWSIRHTECVSYTTSVIVYLAPEAQMDVLKSATPEDEEYFFTVMAENGDRKIQHKLNEELAVRWAEKFNNGAPEQAVEQGLKNAGTPAKRLQDIVSATP